MHNHLPWENLIILAVFGLVMGSVGLVLAHRESKQRRAKMAAEKKADILSSNEIQSLREWLASWGPMGTPSWADPTGQSIPVVKAQFEKLLDTVDHWKKRAAQHGCNVEGGDHECG